MMKLEDICELYRVRLNRQGLLLGKAREFTNAYNGDIAVPLPELDKNERVALPNLLRKGLDQTSQRIFSTLPDVNYPPMKDNKSGKEKALLQRKATLGWWQDNGMGLIGARRARHLLGYACSPVRIRWSFTDDMPRWSLMDPLATFPAVTENPDDCLPDDCIFAYSRSLSWLRQRYPDQVSVLSKGDKPTRDSAFDVIEYIDDNEIVVAAIGKPVGKDYPDTPPWQRQPVTSGRMEVELERVPNRVGQPLAVVAGSIALERKESAYNGMIGLFQAAAKLMALEVIAVTEGVWPKTWLVARPSEHPEVVQEADPKHGITGIVSGGTIEQTQLQPGYKTTDTIDRLYQAQLVDGGIPPDMTGQSGTNIRTGARGSQLQSAVVDFPIQEAHRIFERSMETENSIAIATAKTYGKGKRTFYVNWKGAKGRVDYDPATDFVTTTNFVDFPSAGSDFNQLIVGIGQRLSTRMISRVTARKLDPDIEDPEYEERQTTADALQDALLAAVGQDVAKGTYTAVEVAEMKSHLEDNPESSLAEVVAAIQQRHQEAQASQMPPGAPQMQPGLTPGPGGPGGQAQTAMQQGQPQPGQIGPTQNEQGLAQLLGALHQPAQMAANG